MKDLSAKKIVLSSIGLFSAVMLLVGLAFRVIGYTFPGAEAAGAALGTEVNGFDMLSFKYPILLSTFFDTIRYSSTMKSLGVGFGIFSILSLVVSIAAVALIITLFFLASSKKCRNWTLVFLLAALGISVLYAVLAICGTVTCNEGIKELGEAAVFSMKTSAWVSIIFQAVACVAFFLCNKLLPEKRLTSTKEKASSASTERKPSASLKELLEGERSIIDVIKEYKALFDAEILSSADFVSKKTKLLQFAEKTVRNKILQTGNQNLSDVVEGEKTVVSLIKEYRALVDDNTLSSAEYIDKKGALLTYVIN